MLSEWQLTKDELVVQHGAVVAHHRLAVEAGLKVLQEGGNAVDAAVATSLALSVVEPPMSGVGGGGFMIVHLAERRETVAVDFGMRAPAAARPEMFELEPEEAPNPYLFRKVKGNANRDSFLACAVPGEVAGLCAALERFGTISRQKVMAPALRLAREGFPMNWFLALWIYNNLSRYRRYPGTAAVYLKGDDTYHAPLLESAGDMILQPDLARTLEEVAEGGPEAFYQGRVARRIVEHLQADGGILTLRDFADYAPRIGPPLRAPYRSTEVAVVPQVTGGPLVVASLNLLERFDLGALGHNSPDALHLIAECARRAFIDRHTFMGDPELAVTPYSGLTSREYATARAAEISMDRATPDAGPGNPWPFSEVERPAGWLPGRGRAGLGNTTHLTVVDEARNVVAVTKTAAHFVVPGTGVMMNMTLGEFDPEPGHPNSLAGGKRHLSNMTPTILLRDGRPFAAFGSPGDCRIPNAVIQVALNLVDFGMGIQEAVSAPRLDCSTPLTLIDDRISGEVLAELSRRGHRLTPRHEEMGYMSFARPNGVLVDEESGLLRAGSYPFFHGVAAGY